MRLFRVEMRNHYDPLSAPPVKAVSCRSSEQAIEKAREWVQEARGAAMSHVFVCVDEVREDDRKRWYHWNRYDTSEDVRYWHSSLPHLNSTEDAHRPLAAHAAETSVAAGQYVW